MEYEVLSTAIDTIIDGIKSNLENYHKFENSWLKFEARSNTAVLLMGLSFEINSYIMRKKKED